MASTNNVEGWIQRWAQPRVLLLPSEAAERAVAVNGLTLVQILRVIGATLAGSPANERTHSPASSSSSSTPTAYFRSVSRSYTLKHFGLSFVSSLDLAAAAPQSFPDGARESPAALFGKDAAARADGYLDALLRSPLAEPSSQRFDDGINDALDVASFIRRTQDPTPWYTLYRREYLEVLRFHESELIDMPMATMIAISSVDPDPINTIEQLRSHAALPAVYAKGVYDTPNNMARCILVIHDKHEDGRAAAGAIAAHAASGGSAENNESVASAAISSLRARVDATYRSIKQKYGAEVLRMIELNSVAPDQLANSTTGGAKYREQWMLEVERMRWQLKQAEQGPPPTSPKSGSTANSSASTAAFPLPPPHPSHPSHAPALSPSPSPSHLHSGTPSPGPLGFGPNSTLASPDSPMTPSSRQQAAVNAASVAVATAALAEMDSESTRTVEQEQIMQQQTQSTDAMTSSSSPSMLSNALFSPSPRGSYLSSSDLSTLSSLLADFLLQMLLPHLERRISILGEKVAALRKGIKNSIKAFFGKRDSTRKCNYVPRICTYDWNSIESQERQLADLAFIVQDYELAASTYKLCANDYKNDKILRHYAGSQEMLALSLAMGDTSGLVSSSTLKEVSQCFDAAAITYLSLGDVRRATRVAWFAADVIRWLGGATRISECSAIMLRASEKEVPARAALSMEQAAYLFLHHLPLAQVRKYAFHLIMSGHLFHKASQRKLGVRAYSASQHVYGERAWSHILDHCNYFLAKEYFHLETYQESVQHFVQLIGKAQGRQGWLPSALSSAPLLLLQSGSGSGAGSGSGLSSQQTAEKQATFLKEFAFVVRKWQEYEMEMERQRQKTQVGALVKSNKKVALRPDLIPGLQLPTVHDATVHARSADAHTVPSCYTIAAWNSVLRLNPLMTLDAAACNKPLFSSQWKDYKESDRGCVVREQVHVMFKLSNPLLIPLEVANMRLVCKWKGPTQNKTDGQEQEEEEQESRRGCEMGSTPSPMDAFTYSSLSFTIDPLQGGQIELLVSPLCEGILHVEGVTWDVADVLHGHHPFALPMRQVTFPVIGGRRRKPELHPDPSLVIPVTPPAPLLLTEIDDFPSHMHAGEVVSRTMKLSNAGQLPMHRMCVRLSHPGFIALGTTLEGSHGTPSNEPCYEHTWSEGYISLPLTLAPGQSVTLPIWIRATLEGKHNIQFLVKYEPLLPAASSMPPSSKPALKHRLSYLHFPLLVTPLFSLRAFTRPSFRQIEDALLGMEIVDKQQTIPGLVGTVEYADLSHLSVAPLHLTLTQVSALSRSWRIQPLEQQQQFNASNDDGENVRMRQDGMLSVPTRKLQTSVSSPNVAALRTHAIPPSSQLPRTSSSDASAISVASSSTSSATHRLQPYESLALFVRAASLPPTWMTNANSSGHDNAQQGALRKTTLSSSQSSNAISQQQHHHQHHTPLPMHHSCVAFAPSPSLPSSSNSSPPATLSLDPLSPGLSHLLRMEKSLLVEAERQTLLVNPSAQVADVAGPGRFDLVLLWRGEDATGRTHVGAYHAPGLACLKSQPAACSLKVLLDYPRRIKHDFTQHGPLDVRVGLRVRNTMEEASNGCATSPPQAAPSGTLPCNGISPSPVAPSANCLTFLFETLPPDEEFDSARRLFRTMPSPSIHCRYHWSGVTRSRVENLPPAAVCRLELWARIHAPGSYNLNRFRFTIEPQANSGKKPRVFFFPLQHLIHVEQGEGMDGNEEADASGSNADANAASIDISMPSQHSISSSTLHPDPSSNSPLASVEEVDINDAESQPTDTHTQLDSTTAAAMRPAISLTDPLTIARNDHMDTDTGSAPATHPIHMDDGHGVAVSVSESVHASIGSNPSHSSIHPSESDRQPVLNMNHVNDVTQDSNGSQQQMMGMGMRIPTTETETETDTATEASMIQQDANDDAATPSQSSPTAGQSEAQ